MNGDTNVLLISVRLLTAAVLGGMIGLERESHRRPAGFRTHILVAIGSCLITLVSAYGFKGQPGLPVDPSRIAANIVTGIGFLGAGTILRDGLNIRGLTTAASLWVVSAIGMAVGAGFYYGAILSSAITAVTLVYLDRIEIKYIESKSRTLRVTVQDVPGALGRVASALGDRGISITRLDMRTSAQRDGFVELTIGIDAPGSSNLVSLVDALRTLGGVFRVEAGD